MTSKQDILNSIRNYGLDPIELPAMDHAWIKYEDKLKQFQQVLESVGGQTVFVRDRDEIKEVLGKLDVYDHAHKIYSSIEGIEKANIDLDAIDDPHELEDVDVAIMSAEFGVAENAALWITDVGLKHRVIYFIVQHLVLVVSAKDIVDNMHQAYERLDFKETRFGVFISGPSKTADIEQSLVIGAHGPRSLTVFVVGSHVL